MRDEKSGIGAIEHYHLQSQGPFRLADESPHSRQVPAEHVDRRYGKSHASKAGLTLVNLNWDLVRCLLVCLLDIQPLAQLAAHALTSHSEVLHTQDPTQTYALTLTMGARALAHRLRLAYGPT